MQQLRVMSSTKRRAAAQGFTLVEVTIAVVVLSLIGFVIVPQVLKWLRRTKTAEATQNLQKIYDSSVSYFEAQHGEDGAVAPRRFPPSAGPTPAIDSCCPQPGHKCDPALVASQWTASPTWSALKFSMKEPFYYWYRYDSAGEDRSATFSAWAFGNLDCDKEFSTFMRGGAVDANNAPTAGATVVDKETE